jgi:acylphosphatase
MIRTVRVTVRGEVQGVGFRWFVRSRARELSLAGWVRNTPDGAVELLAQGAVQPVATLIDAVRRGPPAALVAACEIDELPPQHDLLTPFDIRR